MPFLVKHRRAPEPWAVFRKSSPHTYLLPLWYFNWLGDWAAYALSKWAVFEVLEYLGTLSILFAVVFYFADAGDRRKQKHYQAWQVINTAQGKGGSGGRIEALQELNEDGVPLVGIDVSDAFLQEVTLIGADLRRGDFRGTDLRRASLRNARLEGSNLHSANLREADLTRADLTNVSLRDADLHGARLTEADLSGANLDRADLRQAELSKLANWNSIASMTLTNIHGVTNAPADFIPWALAHGAVDIADDAAWERMPATVPTTSPVPNQK